MPEKSPIVRDADVVNKLMNDIDHVKGMRGNWENHWQEIADRILPRQAEFNRFRSDGRKRTEFIFDSTAPIALDRFASTMESLITPRAQEWHKLQASNEDVNKIHAVKKWMEEVTKLLFKFRYSSKANYASQNHEAFMSLGAFGTSGLFVDEDLKRGAPRYRHYHLGDLFLLMNNEGMIDTVYRQFHFTGRQAKQQWPDVKLPDAIEKAAMKGYQNEFEFMHIIKPRTDRDIRRIDSLNMPWASFYVSNTTKDLIAESGYREWPWSIGRYSVAPKEVYGRSPAMLALPDIKMLNEIEKDNIQASHKQINPPLLVHDEGVLGNGGRVDLRAGGINYGGVNSEGRQLIQPMNFGSNLLLSKEFGDGKRKVINDIFLVSLFQILVETPQMTATEVLERTREKGVLLGPTMGRQEAEVLGPMILRELDILAQFNKLPPFPPELIEAGGEFDIVYDSPLSRAQRFEEVTTIQNAFAAATPLFDIDPDAALVMDAKAATRHIYEVMGVPQTVIRSKEDVEAISQDRQRAQQEQQQLEAIPGAASSALDLARANEISTNIQ